MKTIKIRFINRNNKDFLIQKKTWLGWKYIGYSERINFGESTDILYCKDTREELLSEVIKNHYLVDGKIVKIIEYPEIKQYEF